MNVALYARVSTNRQAEANLSIPDQLRQMREWCASRGAFVVAEYVESGASGTDENRPVFQQMITEAGVSPPPFQAILVHSLSRFFRDSFLSVYYEKRLAKFGVRVISITQPTDDDPGGELIRNIMRAYDDYSSKENGKHVRRVMAENARRGFLNGSLAPYGYRKREVQGPSHRHKVVLEIDPGEAEIVRRIFDLYLTGAEAQGVNGIANYLNAKGITRRGLPWSKQVVNKVLSSPVYIGERYYNRRDSRARRVRPENEWIRVESPVILDRETFQKVEALRKERSPKKTPPRIVGSPTLLTGLLRCGSCGSPMTLTTGKSGKYKYYKCTTRINRGKAVCETGNIPMEELDDLVLRAFCDRVLVPERLEGILKELRQDLRRARGGQDQRLQALKAELKDVERRLAKLYEAVEEGLALDASLTERAGRHQARRQDLLIEMAGLRKDCQPPIGKVGRNQLKVLCAVLRERVNDRKSRLGKSYLRLLVEEIRVEGKTVTMKGSHAAMGRLVQETKVSTHPSAVPTFGVDWRARHDSNMRPTDS